MMDELKALVPSPVPVPLSNGQVIEVWPLRARQFAPFAAAIEPLMDEFEFFRQLEGAASPAYWRDLVQRRADDVIAALVAALELPAERIGALFLGDLLALVAVVLQVNIDFFAQAMPQAVAAMTAGRTLLNASSAPDTATPPTSP